ncbi:RNA polymerase sigma factor (sigma-70 family) [Paenarthrobacter nicotinovorans]|uniref:RNA polymerase sigma factor n=1 Tax=Paenarthrobacter nicotinovorans TaxID=29320 RepID=UPI0027867B3B|nr:RNA polymerase sigma factor [Paenarthrobacter nicotinovorans]MDP9934032.1 RNA polymerase sigma factor (sigma-70 family) [Paenarthrobacter nicotinovorans]
MSSNEARAAVEAVWRSESARIVGALARYTGDFSLAEDLAQEALAEAIVSWSVNGIPREPAGWLMTAGKRRAIDTFRRRSVEDEKYALLAHGLSEEVPDTDTLFNPDAIDDDVLALMFISCHPVLSKEARIALTLKVVGGMGTDEIAKAFLVPVATIQARITRAKKTLAAAHIPFAVPERHEIPQRLGSVLQVLYLIFTEGSFASAGDSWMRTELAAEARRLVRVLVRLSPEPEVFGLLGLMELTAARFPARVDAAGNPVLLEDQDRRRWDQAAIRRGRAALSTAVAAGRGLGAYGLQAAIAECHAVARTAAETDWERIAILYEALGSLAPSPVVELNRAVALAMASGPAAGLELVDSLAGKGELAGSHLLPTVRGELLARLGRRAEAVEALKAAFDLCSNTAERTALERKIALLGVPKGSLPVPLTALTPNAQPESVRCKYQI